jgi:hypothetical protein
MKTSDQYAKFLEMKKCWGKMDAFLEDYTGVLHAANEYTEPVFFISILSLAALGFLAIILSASSILQGAYVLMAALVYISLTVLMKQFNLKDYFKASGGSVVALDVAKKMAMKMKFFAHLNYKLMMGFFAFTVWIDVNWLFESAANSNIKQRFIFAFLVVLLFALIYFGKLAWVEFRNLSTKINQLIEIFEDKPSYDCWQEE